MISDNNSDTENKPKTKKCQFCGSTIDVDDKFCPFCGKYLQKVRRCPQCGESYEIDDKFCINCGKRLS